MTAVDADATTVSPPFTCAERLHRANDVRAVFATRRTAASRFAVVHARAHVVAGPPRVTVVAGRNVGNAVRRNRVKRRLRGVVQVIGAPAGADYVLVGRAAAAEAAADELTADVRRLLCDAFRRP